MTAGVSASAADRGQVGVEVQESQFESQFAGVHSGRRRRYRGAMEIRVEHEPGLNGEPEPAVVWFGRRRLAVRAISDRWWGPGRRWWKVETDDGAYVLRREDATGAWELAAVPRGPSGEPGPGRG